MAISLRNFTNGSDDVPEGLTNFGIMAGCYFIHDYEDPLVTTDSVELEDLTAGLQFCLKTIELISSDATLNGLQCTQIARDMREVEPGKSENIDQIVGDPDKTIVFWATVCTPLPQL